MAAENLRQYTGVAIGGRALLIEGPPGIGKTALALCLIDRGAVLIGDDGVALSARGRQLFAAPPRAAYGKLELRNVGIIDLPVSEAPIALIVQLCNEAPRFVGRAAKILIECYSIPALPLAIGASGPTLADTIRAEHALKLHGLSEARQPIDSDTILARGVS